MEENGGKWGKMGNLFYEESGKQIGNSHFFHWLPLAAPTVQPAFIATLRVAAKLDIPVLINLSNCNMILHDVILQLHSIFNGTNINHGLELYPSVSSFDPYSHTTSPLGGLHFTVNF